MRLLRWLFVLFALMYAPAQAADPPGSTPPVVTPSAAPSFTPIVIPEVSDPSAPPPTTPAAAPISGIDPKTELPMNTAEPGVVSPTNGTPQIPDLTPPTLSPLPDAPGVTQPSIPGRPGVGSYPEPTAAEKEAAKEAERKRLVDFYSAPLEVPFPEASTLKGNTSVCQTKRDKTFGNNTQIFNPGKTMESASAIYNALPCPTTWLAQTVKAISNAGLPGYISKLAFAVWFLGIIWTGVRIANGSERAEGRELFARLLISGWLVLGSATTSDQLSEPKFTGNMGQFVRASWVQAYTWGDTTFATPALKRAAEQTANLGEHLSRLVTMYAGLQVIAEAVKGGAQGAAVSTMTTGNPVIGAGIGAVLSGGAAAGSAVAATTQAGILAVNMVMPILLTYYLIITGTGLAAVIASLLLPLVGAMFVFGTGLGMQYAETWFKTAASAVLMMALMPVFFTASMELGFVEPARNFDNYTTRAEVSLKAEYTRITEYAKQGKIGWLQKNWEYFTNWLKSVQDKFDAVGYLNSMLTSLLLMVFSLIAGLYTLRIAQNWIIEFLSGVASAVAGGGAPNFGAALGSTMKSAGAAASAAAGTPQNIARAGREKDAADKRAEASAKTSPNGNTPSTPGNKGGGTPGNKGDGNGGGLGMQPGGSSVPVKGGYPVGRVGGGQGKNNIVPFNRTGSSGNPTANGTQSGKQPDAAQANVQKNLPGLNNPSNRSKG